MTAVCRYCTHLTHAEPGTPTGRAWEPLEWACMHKLEVRPGRHSCERFEREPGVDDDLERANTPTPVPTPIPHADRR